MNSRFYIKSLTVSGEGKPDAVVKLDPGFNLIIGPSNSGKSLVIDCIDYIFGYNNKKTKDARYRLDSMRAKYGYDTVKVVISRPEGDLTFTRILGENKVSVDSQDPDIKPGSYSTDHNAKRSIDGILLHLIGIDEPHDILASKGGKTNALTWRGIAHMFFVRQDDIDRGGSPIINPAAETVSQTSSPAALLYLLTGTDASFVSKKSDPKTISKHDGVVEYIEKKLTSLEQEKKNAQSADDPEFTSGIHEFTTSVDELRAQISDGISESKNYMDQIYAVDGEISECRIMQHQFQALRAQYQADIDRMTFVVKGELAMNDAPENHTCPFCGGAIQPSDNPTYIEGARSNLSHIIKHLEDLDKAEAGLLAKLHSLEKKKNKLVSKKNEIDAKVRQLTEEKRFMTRVQDYAAKLLTMRTVAQIEAEQERYKNELISLKASAPDKTKDKYDIKDYYNERLMQDLTDSITRILRKFRFPQASTAHFDTDTWDVQFGEIVKTGIAGGGYSSIINTALILAIQENIMERNMGQSVPLMFDSSLTALSESEYTADRDTIRDNFIKFLMERRGESQLILAEQKEKMPAFIIEKCGPFEDYHEDNFSIIQFTHDPNHGRVGFFPDIFEF